ncbi:MAG: phosphoglycerate mutase family protein, partial [Methanocorpusculum sp.]|nr:phosphoglycerate mutase family protein [Methanocorpusculum sp.]
WFFIDRTGRRLCAADEPDDTFPRGTVRYSPPANRIAEITAAKEYDACIILIRHAEREPFQRGEPGPSKQLTERGREQAAALGARLPKIRAAYASPMTRCMQTAELIAGKPAEASTMLGDPGAFIYDNALSHEFYCRTSTIAAIRSYIQGDVLPGHYPIREGAKRILSFLKSLAQENGTVLCVTHDAFAVSLIAVMTGADFSDDWLDFLDGCVIFRRGTNWTLVWRGGEAEI